MKNGYEFLLDYPGINGHNIWFQSNSPLDESKEENKLTVTGYRHISITWSGCAWGGLFKSTLLSLIDGSYDISRRWFSLGRTNSFNSSVPGPCMLANKTRLWIRVPDIAYFTCKGMQKSIFSNKILLFYHILCS